MNINDLAASYLTAVREEVEKKQYDITILGISASDDPSVESYIATTQSKCEAASINYKIQRIAKDGVAAAIKKANANNSISGIFIYFPIFGDQRDDELKNLVDYKKDIEGLSNYWNTKLADNERKVCGNKSILPCTALACLKALEITDIYDSRQPFTGKKIAIFNRSKVVGDPLARMISNDGGTVYSFDADGCKLFSKGAELPTSETRASILNKCNIIITGVPTKSFRIEASEVNAEAVCLNFSHYNNFSNEAKEKSRVFIPKVGPLTIAMCIRNVLRVHKDYHLGAPKCKIKI